MYLHPLLFFLCVCCMVNFMFCTDSCSNLSPPQLSLHFQFCCIIQVMFCQKRTMLVLWVNEPINEGPCMDDKNECMNAWLNAWIGDVWRSSDFGHIKVAKFAVKFVCVQAGLAPALSVLIHAALSRLSDLVWRWCDRRPWRAHVIANGRKRLGAGAGSSIVVQIMFVLKWRSCSEWRGSNSSPSILVLVETLVVEINKVAGGKL